MLRKQDRKGLDVEYKEQFVEMFSMLYTYKRCEVIKYIFSIAHSTAVVLATIVDFTTSCNQLLC